MIKGYSKRIIVVKDPSSNYFDEAHFILKERFADPKQQTPSCEAKMIDEANRIISDSIITKYCTPTPPPKKASIRFSPIAIYIMGMATSCLIIAMCKLVLF